MIKNKINYRQNYKFTDSALSNEASYYDYLNRLKKIALSIFEWINLPSSMNARWLERCLYYNGKCALLKDKKLGFINTGASTNGYINIYGIPTQINCWSFNYTSMRKTYTGLPNNINDNNLEKEQMEKCVLVLNDWEANPTCSTLELFALRLSEAEKTMDVNIKSQKFPVMIIVDEKQRLLMENLYNQYNGNQPFLFGDKEQLGEGMLRSVNTGAPYVIDKITQYKKEIWNEALSFLGVNTIALEKKERLITDEANYNNEFINYNLQSYLAPRLEACKEFNELFGLTGTDKEISVRIRSDLANIIKKEMSITKDFNPNSEEIKEGVTYEDNL